MSLSNKEKYRLLCQEKPIPLFMQAWWMDAVCCEGKEWDVLLYEKDGKIQGALVYHLLKKFGFKLVLQPELTQYNGIWIDYPDEINQEKKLSLEKKIMDNLNDQLEAKDIDLFDQKFHYSIKNWQPLYWKGYKQTTNYTYVIKGISDYEKAFENFSYAKKKQIKKSFDTLSADFSISDDELYKFHSQCLNAKGKKITYSKDLLKSIYVSATYRKQAQIIGIRDNKNKLHAASLFVWDNQSSYNIITSIDPDYNASGASTRVIWEGIKFLSDKAKNFDFEGSMIEGVARSFQQYGTDQVPYFSIKKCNSIFLSLILKLKG